MIWITRKAAAMQLTVEQIRTHPISKIIKQGVILKLLNPKTVLFFALFLTPFIKAGHDMANPMNVQAQLLILGTLMPLTVVPSDILIAFLGGSLSKRMNEQQDLRTGMAWVGGLTLIAIALNLHFSFILVLEILPKREVISSK